MGWKCFLWEFSCAARAVLREVCFARICMCGHQIEDAGTSTSPVSVTGRITMVPSFFALQLKIPYLHSCQCLQPTEGLAKIGAHGDSTQTQNQACCVFPCLLGWVLIYILVHSQKSRGPDGRLHKNLQGRYPANHLQLSPPASHRSHPSLSRRQPVKWQRVSTKMLLPKCSTRIKGFRSGSSLA